MKTTSNYHTAFFRKCSFAPKGKKNIDRFNLHSASLSEPSKQT